MTSIICLFKLGHPNDLNGNFRDVTYFRGHLNDLNGYIKEALKSSIFVVQKAAAPKIGVEFRQGSIGNIRSILATSYNVWRCHTT